MKKNVCIVFASIFLLFCACAQQVQPEILLEGSAVRQLTVYAGQELQLQASPADGTWSSSDPTVVQVEADGYLRAKMEGTATVTLTAGKNSAILTVTVTPYIPVESLSCGEKVTAKIGVPKELKTQVLPANASDPSVRFEIEPMDGHITIQGSTVTLAETAQPGTVYQVTAINDRSGVSCTFRLEVSELKGLTAWTIGDSIFDFRDNGENDMVQTILRESGYTNFYMDNIAGSTVRAASAVGIIEHLDNGMYEAWPEPELIVLFRGTNDCYYSIQQPNFFTEDSIIQAVQDTCRRLREMHPDARIVWATPMWRVDVTAERLDWLRKVLHDTCPQYGVEVFDLHEQAHFAALAEENYGAVLYDGIHPSDVGAQYLKEAFIACLTGKEGGTA